MTLDVNLKRSPNFSKKQRGSGVFFQHLIHSHPWNLGGNIQVIQLGEWMEPSPETPSPLPPRKKNSFKVKGASGSGGAASEPKQAGCALRGFFTHGKNGAFWNPNNGGGWKMIFPFRLGRLFSFHVDFPGCKRMYCKRFRNYIVSLRRGSSSRYIDDLIVSVLIHDRFLWRSEHVDLG